MSLSRAFAMSIIGSVIALVFCEVLKAHEPVPAGYKRHSCFVDVPLEEMEESGADLEKQDV